MTTELTDEQKHALPKKPDGTPYAIMIVDDSDFMVNNLKRIVLSFEGSVSEIAHDGREAVEKFQAMPEKPDLITMDLTMPRMNGLDAIREIRALHPAQKIIVVSALGQKELIQQAILLGAKHFIVKPFQRQDVYRVVRSVLGIKSSEPA